MSLAQGPRGWDIPVRGCAISCRLQLSGFGSRPVCGGCSRPAVPGARPESLSIWGHGQGLVFLLYPSAYHTVLPRCLPDSVCICIWDCVSSSRADGHFVFTVPFGGCIGVLSLLLLAFQKRGKADAGLGGRHRNACQFTESGQQVDSGLGQ